jgi:nitrogen fixation/metabolism regulation signal transduction histidine kinase
MRMSWSFGRMITSMTLMCIGVLLMFVIVTVPVITEINSGIVFANLIIGATLLILGFGIFTNQLKIPKRQKKEKTYQKSKHKFIEIFGLE